MRRLPPMNSIRAFEAAVRLGSFSAAAGELGVTHGAISRQVKVIDGFLGIELFKPSGRGLEPTELAREYALELRAGLDRIGLATEQIAEPTTSRVLRVNSTHTFAIRWLIPRLSTFQDRYPGIDVRLSTSSTPIEQVPDPFDVVIRRYAMQFPGFECRPVLEDVRLPVCAPEVLARRPITCVADLVHHTLLCPKRPSGVWDQWLSLAGLDTDLVVRRQRFENFYVALQAAIEGLGLALAPLQLVANDLAAGRLVTPFRQPTLHCHPIEVLYPLSENRNRRTDAFIGWLSEQARSGSEELSRVL
jgi:LysR family glycine cleavage system transcriptional activator